MPGLLNSIGIGLGAAANAAQPFILNMQQAEIQKLRDDRMAEIAKDTAKYASGLETGAVVERQKLLAPGLLSQKQGEADIEIASSGKKEQARLDMLKDPSNIKAIGAKARAEHIDDSAGKISFQPIGDGRIAKVDKAGNITGFMTDPETGKPLIGKKDVADSQVALARSYFEDAKNAATAGDSDAATKFNQQGRDALTGKQVGESTSGSAPASGKIAPSVGEVHNGYKFKGGNPNAKENWESVTQEVKAKPKESPVDADTLALQNAYAAQQKGVADNRASLIAKYNRDIENVKKSIKDPKARDQAIANLQSGARKSGIIN